MLRKLTLVPVAIYGLSFEDIKAFGKLDAETFLNPNCSDYDLETAEECEEICIGEMIDCIIECSGDSACASSCGRVEVDCIDSCPCHSLCFEGCDGCANHICTCRDHDEDFNYQNCLLDAEVKFGNCFIGCDHDQECITGCNLQFDYDYEHCPCQQFCPGGCPCEGEGTWDCIETTTTSTTTSTENPEVTDEPEETTVPETTSPVDETTTAEETTTTQEDTTTTINTTEDTNTDEARSLLVLNTQRPANTPYLIDMETGFVHSADLFFTMGPGTEASHSCSTFFNGRHWMFGGGKEKRQISTVEGCSLVRVGNLPYDFDYGTCGTYTLRETIDEEVLMCFDNKDQSGCHAWDGTGYRLLPSSNSPHGDSRLANYKGMVFVTGSEGPNNVKTEILVHVPDSDLFVWGQVADYPFSDGVISNYAQISTDDAVIILGGYSKQPKSHKGSKGQVRKSYWGPSDVIAQYKSGVWSQIGSLLQSRYGHCASAYNGKAYVVGGGEGGRYKTEMMILYKIEEFEGFTQSYIPLELENYYYYPELLQVEEKFCTIGNLP